MLAVICTFMLNGQLETLAGEEIARKSTASKMYVYFASINESTYLPINDCQYTVNPATVAVDSGPSQPELTPEEERLWATEPGLTVKAIIARRKDKK